jgi:hypothetical protein
MAACKFAIPFSGSAQDIVNKARTAIQGQGGTFNGDTNAGDFHVSVMGSTISGSYSVAGEVMSIVVDNKPFFIPCSTLEGLLKNQIRG